MNLVAGYNFHGDAMSFNGQNKWVQWLENGC